MRSKPNSTKRLSLIKLLRTTLDHGERDRTAILIANTGNIAYVPELIRCINSDTTIGHRSTLVYACSEFDCSKWVIEFMKIWIYNSKGIEMDLLAVFEEMKSISDDNAKVASKMLKDALEDGAISSDNRNDSINLIEHLENTHQTSASM